MQDVVATHNTELGHFENDLMQTEAAEATICDYNNTFNLFQCLKNWVKFFLLKILLCTVNK